MPPVPPTLAQYPFQCLCADFCSYSSKHYLVLVDRYSNWPIVRRTDNGAKGVVDALRICFASFGIPEELATDGRPEFTSGTTTQFLKDWGVHHRWHSLTVTVERKSGSNPSNGYSLATCQPAATWTRMPFNELFSNTETRLILHLQPRCRQQCAFSVGLSGTSSR